MTKHHKPADLTADEKQEQLDFASMADADAADRDRDAAALLADDAAALAKAAEEHERDMQGATVSEYTDPTMPERFSTGGATYDERAAWLAANQG